MRSILYRHFEEVVGGSLLVVMCLIGVIKVVARYAFTAPLAWTEELATLLFAWLVFIGASLALKKHEHFAIELLVDLLPYRLRQSVHHVQRIAVAIFCVLLIVFGTNLVMITWSVRTPLLDVSRGWLYASVPFGGVLMLLRTLEPYLVGPAGLHPKSRTAEEAVE